MRAYERETARYEIDTDKLGEYVGSVTGAEFNDAFLALTNIKDTAQVGLQSVTYKFLRKVIILYYQFIIIIILLPFQRSYEKHKWDNSMRYDYWDGFTHPLKSTNGSDLPLAHSDRYQVKHLLLLRKVITTVNMPLVT